ncbi:MAG: sulfotransferase [Bacteroidia bacterium]|nr:sulfotransferase [Bacteroidia bacterium]
MDLKSQSFPVHTEINPDPKVIYQALDVGVFDFPFFNEGADFYASLNDQPGRYLRGRVETETENLLEIRGFIFHTSHCGSTLLAEMLKASPKIRVVSEPEAVNGLILAYLFYDLEMTWLENQLRKVLEDFLQPLGSHQGVIFKLSPWNVFFRDVFARIYPVAKWIYLDRKTEEVVASLLKSDGGMESWWDHPTDLLRKYFVRENHLTRGEYLTALVNAHREQARLHADSQLLSMHYPEFIGQFEKEILPHFDLKFTEEELSRSRERLIYHSKSRGKLIFS